MQQGLLETISNVYKKCNLQYSTPVPEEESKDYVAYHFKVNNRSVRFRVAKITPSKAGQFVTIWKRDDRGPMKPFAAEDQVDLSVVFVRYKENVGQFIFPKSILLEKDILSKDGKSGKRAFRVYPPWDKDLNKQASRTQKWQLNYFLNLTDEKCNYEHALMLYANG